MAIESTLDLVSAIMIFFAGTIPAYLSLKLKGDVAVVTAALSVFIVIHGTYHVVRMQGQELADGVFEPASVVALIAFGATYIGVVRRRMRRRKKEATGR